MKWDFYFGNGGFDLLTGSDEAVMKVSGSRSVERSAKDCFRPFRSGRAKGDSPLVATKERILSAKMGIFIFLDFSCANLI